MIGLSHELILGHVVGSSVPAVGLTLHLVVSAHHRLLVAGHLRAPAVNLDTRLASALVDNTDIAHPPDLEILALFTVRT